MTKFFRDFVCDESGASAAEYALILAIVGGVIVVAATTLSGAIAGAMNCTAEHHQDLVRMLAKLSGTCQLQAGRSQLNWIKKGEAPKCKGAI